MSLTYSETVSQAAERLETAKAALPRDLAQAATPRGGARFCATNMMSWSSLAASASALATTFFSPNCMLLPIR